MRKYTTHIVIFLVGCFAGSFLHVSALARPEGWNVQEGKLNTAAESSSAAAQIADLIRQINLNSSFAGPKEIKLSEVKAAGDAAKDRRRNQVKRPEKNNQGNQ